MDSSDVPVAVCRSSLPATTTTNGDRSGLGLPVTASTRVGSRLVVPTAATSTSTRVSSVAETAIAITGRVGVLLLLDGLLAALDGMTLLTAVAAGYTGPILGSGTITPHMTFGITEDC
jgi:hypothetical protein